MPSCAEPLPPPRPAPRTARVRGRPPPRPAPSSPDSQPAAFEAGTSHGSGTATPEPRTPELLRSPGGSAARLPQPPGRSPGTGPTPRPSPAGSPSLSAPRPTAAPGPGPAAAAPRSRSRAQSSASWRGTGKAGTTHVPSAPGYLGHSSASSLPYGYEAATKGELPVSPLSLHLPFQALSPRLWKDRHRDVPSAVLLAAGPPQTHNGAVATGDPILQRRCGDPG